MTELTAPSGFRAAGHAGAILAADSSTVAFAGRSEGNWAAGNGGGLAALSTASVTLLPGAAFVGDGAAGSGGCAHFGGAAVSIGEREPPCCLTLLASLLSRHWDRVIDAMTRKKSDWRTQTRILIKRNAHRQRAMPTSWSAGPAGTAARSTPARASPSAAPTGRPAPPSCPAPLAATGAG